jgi:CheY-like chemotaxis protein
VDDNVDFAVGLATILAQRGHDVRIAHDGAAALELTKTFSVELAFLDIGMPKMSGYELAQRLRQRPGMAKVQLIAVTGWGQEGDRNRARLAGFDHHFVKPVDFEAIYAVVESGPPAAFEAGGSL